MKYSIYAVYSASPDKVEEAVFVKEGFSFLAFIFTFFWTLYHRLWLPSIAIAVFYALFTQLESRSIISHAVGAIIQAGVGFYIGFNANDWLAARYTRKGYTLIGVVYARNESDAQLRFFDNWKPSSSPWVHA